jgi:hypothetical protein
VNQDKCELQVWNIFSCTFRSGRFSIRERRINSAPSYLNYSAQLTAQACIVKNHTSPMSILTSSSLPETVPVSDSTVLNCLGSIDSCSTTIDPKAPTSPSSTLQCSVNESTSIPSYKNSSALVSASVDEQSSSSSVDDSDSLDGQDSDSHVSSFY